MNYKCVVPTCRGNYKNGPTVKVFSFPTNKELRQKWITSIKRENFEPTIYSKVCELHFRPSDILAETSTYDEKSGKIISAPLYRARFIAMQKDKE